MARVARAVVLTHADFEGPSRIAPLLVERGYTVERLAVHRGDPVPRDLDPDEPLVIMGGPMGVGDIDSPSYPFLRPELELVRRRVAEGSPVLGVCLGAQLLARAAGAGVRPMTSALWDGSDARLFEVGWAPVRFHHDGDDGALAGLPTSATVFHWHGDTFDLPRGARRLASSERCQNQAFRLGLRSFGLQFHCESTAADVEALLRADAAFARKAVGEAALDRIVRETPTHIEGLRDVGDRLLRNILCVMSNAPR